MQIFFWVLRIARKKSTHNYHLLGHAYLAICTHSNVFAECYILFIVVKSIRVLELSERIQRTELAYIWALRFVYNIIIIRMQNKRALVSSFCVSVLSKYIHWCNRKNVSVRYSTIIWLHIEYFDSVNVLRWHSIHSQAHTRMAELFNDLRVSFDTLRNAHRNRIYIQNAGPLNTHNTV